MDAAAASAEHLAVLSVEGAAQRLDLGADGADLSAVLGAEELEGLVLGLLDVVALGVGVPEDALPAIVLDEAEDRRTGPFDAVRWRRCSWGGRRRQRQRQGQRRGRGNI